MDKFVEKAKQIIENNNYLTLATSTLQGKPWISALFFAYDKDYNLYFVSAKDSLHSNLISQNPDAAVSIYDSSAKVGEANGVFMEAIVSELSDLSEIEKAIKIYNDRVLLKEFLMKSSSEVMDNSVLRMYKCVPQKVYGLTDTTISGQFVTRRVETRLNSDKV